MSLDNKLLGVIILIGGILLGVLTHWYFADTEVVMKYNPKAERINDSLELELKKYNTLKENLERRADSLTIEIAILDSIIKSNEKQDKEIKNKIMGGTSDSAYSVVRKHLSPDSAK